MNLKNLDSPLITFTKNTLNEYDGIISFSSIRSSNPPEYPTLHRTRYYRFHRFHPVLICIQMHAPYHRRAKKHAHSIHSPVW